MIKKNFLISVFKVLCGLIFSCAALYYLYQANDTFLYSHVVSENTYTHASPQTPDYETLKALNQPFYYLSKGCQSYVFASHDGKYVLKLVKYQRYKNSSLQEWASLLSFKKTNLNKILAHRKEKLEKMFASYVLAYQYLKKETGLIYIHLDKSFLPLKSLTLYDRLGFKYLFNASSLEFLLQKRCEKMFLPTLEEYMQAGEEEKAKKLLDDLIFLLKNEYERGWVDHDILVTKNIGIHEGLPIKIDIGRYAYCEEYKNPELYFPHLHLKSARLHNYLAKRFPNLESHLLWRLNQIEQELFPLKN